MLSLTGHNQVHTTKNRTKCPPKPLPLFPALGSMNSVWRGRLNQRHTRVSDHQICSMKNDTGFRVKSKSSSESPGSTGNHHGEASRHPCCESESVSLYWWDPWVSHIFVAHVRYPCYIGSSSQWDFGASIPHSTASANEHIITYHNILSYPSSIALPPQHIHV